MFDSTVLEFDALDNTRSIMRPNLRKYLISIRIERTKTISVLTDLIRLTKYSGTRKLNHSRPRNYYCERDETLLVSGMHHAQQVGRRELNTI